MYFVIVTIIFNLLCIWFMPKKLSWKEIYITWGIFAAITINTDIIVGEIIDLYDFTAPGLQFEDVFIDALLPPSFAIIFLNFMPEDNNTFIKYLVFWTAFSVSYEWAAVHYGFIILKGWSLWYSFLVYFLVFLLLRWHLKFIRKIYI
ncbi:MAG: hypothetical protein PHO01_07230 [Desulfotomaculaceae bacterium]|nr:hypothetical protein [Desulfotomaculaceae bacterium]